MKTRFQLFCPATGLAAFLIGCLAAGLFAGEKYNEPASTLPTLPAKKIEFKRLRWLGEGKERAVEPTPEPIVAKPTMPFCHDKNILPIWNQIRRKSTSEDWRNSINSNGVADCSKLVDVMYFNLDGEGSKEILVRAGGSIPFCGATGNCRFWIFRKEGRRYRELLETCDYVDINDMGDQILRTRSNGFNDILVKHHFSASDTGYSTYKYDGRKYVMKTDLVEAYFPNKNGDPDWKFISTKEYWERGY